MEPLLLSMQHFIKWKPHHIECQHGINEAFHSALDGTNELELSWGDVMLVPCIQSQDVSEEVNNKLILSSIA